MTVATDNRRGRPPTASRADVLGLGTELYLDGQRVDLTVVARRLGVSRATIYRWFGSRDALLGEVIARQLELLVAHKRAQVKGRGADGLLEVFDRLSRTLTQSRALRRLLAQERQSAMRLLTSSGGVVQPRAVDCIAAMIAAEVSAGAYEPPTDPETLAYSIVRLFEAFVYNDATVGIRGDCERLRVVQAALLGAEAKTAGPSALRRPTS